MSTSCIDPRGSTLSPENPLRWAFIGFIEGRREDDVGQASVVNQDPMYCFVGYDDPYY